MFRIEARDAAGTLTTADVELTVTSPERPAIKRFQVGESPVDPAKLEAAIAEGPRLLVLNTPANPGGRVWTQAQLERLAALLQATDSYNFV